MASATTSPMNDLVQLSFRDDDNSLIATGVGDILILAADALKEPHVIAIPDSIDMRKEFEQRNRDDPRRPSNGLIWLGLTVLSADGKQAATVGKDGTIHVWNVATRTVRYALRGARQKDLMGGGVTTMAFSPDTQWLAAAVETGWEPDIGKIGHVEAWRLPKD